MRAAAVAATLRLPKTALVVSVVALAFAMGAVAVGPVAQPEVTPKEGRRRRRARRMRSPRRPTDSPRRVPQPSRSGSGAQSGLYALPGSPARPFAETLAWLWRLGPVADAPGAGAVGIGVAREAPELAAAATERRSSGAIVLAAGSGPELGPVPGRRLVRGLARFERGAAVRDEYTVFAGGEPVVQTALGAHAVRDGRTLVVGTDPVARWGRLSAMWALQPIQAHLVEVLDRPLVTLPPLGCLRFDDLPGTIYMQLEGSDKGDERTSRRIERLHRAFAAAGAKLNLAVAARGLAGDRHVPAEQVWPDGIEAVRRGVEAGVFEIVCHGLLHYDEAAYRDEGRLDPREFRRLDYADAARHLDLALKWLDATLAPPRSFVAPAWGYSPGTLRAAGERGLGAWHRAGPGPLIVDGNPRETLIGAGGIGGVHGVEYGSLSRLAAAGVPPTPVLHGLSLDDRLAGLLARDALANARLLVRRDALRLPSVSGIRWVGAGELLERLQAHDQIAVAGTEPRLPDGAEAVVVSRRGRALARR